MQSYTLEEPSMALLNSTLNDGSHYSSPSTSIMSSCHRTATDNRSKASDVTRHVKDIRAISDTTPQLSKSKIPTPQSNQRSKHTPKSLGDSRSNPSADTKRSRSQSKNRVSSTKSLDRPSSSDHSAQAMHSKPQSDCPRAQDSKLPQMTEETLSDTSKTRVTSLRHRQLFKVLDACPPRPLTPSPPGRCLTPTPPERPKSEMGTVCSRKKRDAVLSGTFGKIADRHTCTSHDVWRNASIDRWAWLTRRSHPLH